MDKSVRIWNFTFLLWVASTVLFMAAMSIGSALFFAACIYFFYQKDSLRIRPLVLQSWYSKATLILVLMACLSWLYAWISPPLGIPLPGIGESKKITYFLLPIFAAWTLLNLSSRQRVRIEESSLWPVLFWASALVSLVAIFQHWAPQLLAEEILKRHEGFFRMASGIPHAHGQGLMGFHLSFASALCFSFCYSFGKLLWLNPRRKPREFWFLAVVSLLTFAAILFSYSRIAWIALPIMMLALVGFRKPNWILIAVPIIGIFSAVVWFSNPDLRIRFVNPVGWVDRSQLYRNALEMFLDRPILGVGFGKSGFYADAYAEKLFGVNTVIGSHAHNNLLDALATTGILGTLAYLLWWTVLLCYCVRAFREADYDDRWLPAALFVGALAFQINGLTQVNFYDAKSEHSLALWAGIILALDWRKKLKGC